MANALHAHKLLTYSGSEVSIGSSALIVCTGTSGMNDTGLTLSLTLVSGKKALPVGDAVCAHVGLSAVGNQYDLLIVTHHGADFVVAVPATTSAAAL